MNGPDSLALTPAEQERVAEIARLASLGASGVPGLIELLTERSWSVRREAVRALGAQGQAAASALCAVLRTRRDNEARIAAAVDALVASSGDLLEELGALARDADRAVVADAAQVLGRRRGARGVPVLAALVTHPDDNVAVAAVEALGRIGGPLAIDALIAAVQSNNFFRVFPAIDVLGRCGDPRAIPPLAALSSSSLYQLEVARALGRTGESAAVAPLAAALTHSSEAVVRVATVALADLLSRHQDRYGNQEAPRAALQRAQLGASVVDRLHRLLPSATHEERLAIAELLGAIGGQEAAEPLRELLEAPGQVSHAAAQALKRLGKESDQQVREALREGDSERRLVLLSIITRGVFEPELVECLRDEAPSVRALACEVLARVGATGAAGALFELLSDPNRRVVQSAMGAIQSLGSVRTRALALHYARSSVPEVRRRALQILTYFGAPEALPLFLSALKDEDLPTREASLAGLALLDAPEALEALLASAGSPQEKIRCAAMRALAQCVRADPQVDVCLLSGLDDSNDWVRYYACQALGQRQVEPAASRLEALLQDEAGQVRVAAIEALSHLKAPAAQDALRKSAQGSDQDMQRAALIGLGHSKLSSAVPLLLAASAHAAPATRLVALCALTDCVPAQALPALKAAVHDPDENVRSAALGSLAGLGLPGATAVLVELAASPADRLRVAPMLSSPAEGRVAGLSTALQSADDELAPVLASALARLRTPEAEAVLLRAISSGPAPARKAAAASLASIHSPAAMAALGRAAETDPDAQVRQICGVLLSH